MAKKPGAALTPQPPAGRLPFDQVVGVDDDSISGTRDTPLPLKMEASTPQTAAFDGSTFDASTFAAAPLPQKVSNAALSASGVTEPIIPATEPRRREPQHHVLKPETGKYSVGGHVPAMRVKKKTVVIRSKAQVIREAGLLITVLEDALGYRPGVLHNAPAPELWNQFDLENRAAFELISELVTELKKLNAFLTTQSRTLNKRKVVTDLQKVGLKVLQRYGTTAAVGAGVLTVGALCMLLQHIGAGDVVENAMFWKRIGH
jgi:hypothetical protein